MVIFQNERGEVQYEQVWEETEAALRRTKRYTEAFETVQKGRYIGNAYSSESVSSGGDGQAPENTYYEFSSLVIPRIIYDNPRIKVGTRRAEAQRMTARAMEVGLNRWCRDVNLRRFIAQGPAMDMLFNWGIVLVVNEERTSESSKKKRKKKKGGGMADKTAFSPKLYRISPSDYFEDPLADSRDEVRFQGHRFRIDKDDLVKRAQEEDGWNVQAVKDLQPSSEENKGPEAHLFRNEVEIREVFVAEIDTESDEENTNGTILTLAASGAGSVSEIREPRAFYGPRWGPYTVFGVYTVPDDPRPLAPLQAAEGSIDGLNRFAMAVEAADMRYKKVVFVGDTDPKLAQRVKSGQDGYVIPITADANTFFQEAEFGGASPAQINQLMMRRERVDRTLGLSEGRRAQTSSTTATAVQVATESADIRIDFIKRQLADGVVNMLRTVAYYLYHDERVVFPLGDVNDMEYAEGQSPWFQGGTDDEGDASFDDLELEIEPFSMERANEGLNQQRAVQAFEILTNVAQLAVTAPFFNWKMELAKLGDAMNMPNLGDTFDAEMAMQMAQQQQQAQASPVERSPRLAKPSSRNGPQRKIPVQGQEAQQVA